MADDDEPALTAEDLEFLQQCQNLQFPGKDEASGR